MLNDNSDLIQSALEADLGKRKQEAYITEIFTCINATIDAVHNVKNWARPKDVKSKFPNNMLGLQVRREPKGVALIISPWNYPVILTIEPLVGAIAAGCPVIVKTSELCENFSATLSFLINKYLDPKVVRVVNGAVPETTEVLKMKFGHILYTGNGAVGRIVSRAAAEHLTPTTLELGGKSPAVVSDDANLPVIAKRLLWGKATNAGQTCVAPDYVLCTPLMQEKLIDQLKKVHKEFYPQGIQQSNSFGRIINHRHFERLNNLIKNTKGEIVLGGGSEASDRFIELTIVKNVKADDVLMEGELFGPILPIVTVPSIDLAIDFIRSRDHPLSLYVYTNSKDIREKVFQNTLSGSAVCNDNLLQVGITDLPFGGVGESGHGAYHGERTFEVFTYERAILRSKTWLEFLFTMRYPPYTDSKLHQLTHVLKKPIDFDQPGYERPIARAVTKYTKLGFKFGAIAALVAVAIKKYGRS